MTNAEYRAGEHRIDLHTHSTASDGLHTPDELVRLAREAGLDLIALTDHDTTDGVALASATGAALGVEVIPGIEVNTDLPDGSGEAHVLGYFLDTQQQALQTTLHFLRDARERRGERMVAQLRAAGLDITWERVRTLAQGSVGRPHVAQALVERGDASSIGDAFARYLSRGKPGYVPRFKLAPEDAVRLIRSAWGVPVLAHPNSIAALAERVLPPLIAAGLLGLECYYGQYDEPTVTRLAELAAANGLIATGGTDYHGPGVHATPLGGRYVPPTVVAQLRTASEELRRQPAPPFTVPTPETPAS